MIKDFSGKKVAVLGLGMEGKSLCEFLLKKGAKITVFDQKTASDLGDVYKKYKKRKIRFKLGKGYLKGGLKSFDAIFRSPGVNFNLSQLAEAKKLNTPILSETKLFFDLCPAKIIGVTGTKGKGTTSALIYQILKKAGKKVFLVGNIGVARLKFLPQLDKDSWVVFELSSFQLQDLKKSPHIAVVLFITSDHLDYYRTVKEYRDSKKPVVRFQDAKDFAVLNADDFVSSSFASLTLAQIFYFSRKKKIKGAYVKNQKIFLFDQLIGSVNKLRLRGAHNWDNICAAATAAALVGINKKIIKKAIFSFKGLKHRLELVGRIKGVNFYNDSLSTTPETTIAAIQAFKESIILIAGGSEKGSDYTDLGREIAKGSVKTLILIGKTAERIKKTALKAGFSGKIVYRPGGMKVVVKVAFQKAKPEDVVLLSPACASFDMFKDYKDRGEQFERYVKKLRRS